MSIVPIINKALAKVSIILNRRVYARKILRESRQHPYLFGDVSREVRDMHTALWSPLVGDVNHLWLRHYCTLSSSEDYRFVPEDVFFVFLERILNDCKDNGADVADKNRYSFYVPKKYLPRAYVRYDRGGWHDENFCALSQNEVKQILSNIDGKVVGKPASCSCGGDNVSVLVAKEVNVEDIAGKFNSYVIQELLDQEPGMASFNPSSINTCRIMTFRRPWNGVTSVIASMCRFGCGKEVVDNLAAGGICIDISPEGVLDSKGIGHKYGTVSNHPVTRKTFAGFKVPFYEEMCNACIEVAQKVPGFHILSFDVIARPDGRPCIIEINAKTQGVEQLQMRRPLFGDETEIVRDWCLEHVGLSSRDCLNFS